MNNQAGPQWLLQEYPGQPPYRQPGQLQSMQPSSSGGAPRPPLTPSQFKTPLPSNLPLQKLGERTRQPPLTPSQFKTPLPSNLPLDTLSQRTRQPLSEFKTPLPTRRRTQFKSGQFQAPSYSKVDTARQFAVSNKGGEEAFFASLYSMLDTAKQFAYRGPDVSQAPSYPVPDSAQPFVHPGLTAPQAPSRPVINTSRSLSSSTPQPLSNRGPNTLQPALYRVVRISPGPGKASPARSLAGQRAALLISPEPEGASPPDLKTLLRRRVSVPLWSIVASIVLCLSLLSVGMLAGSAGILPGGSSGSSASNGQTATATETPTPTPTQGPPWTTIQSFQGNGNKRTPNFNVPGDWRLTWTCDPSSFAGGQYNVQIYVYNADGTPLDIAVNTVCAVGVTGDSVEEHQGGTISLAMNSPAVWTMQVQVLK